MVKESVITLESTIANINDVEKYLINYSKLYSSLERKLFNLLKDDPNPKNKYNKLQREYIKDYNIHARVFKSLWRMALGKIKAIKSNLENYKIKRHKKIEALKDKLFKTKNKFKRFNISSKINKLNQINNNTKKVRAMWGSKQLFKKQWNTENKCSWLEQWRIRRDNHIFIIGYHAESFGNSLCQLQTLKKLRLTLPKEFDIKHITLDVDFDKKKKIYHYLKTAIANKKPLSVLIFQNDKNKKWYAQITFSIENECENHYNGTIGVDINYDLISTCSLSKDSNKKEFIDYRFTSDDNNSDKNSQTLSDIVNQLVDRAVIENKTITIEKIGLKNVLKNKKISMVCYSKFISLLVNRCIKMGILLIEVNPYYTSVIGKLKYAKPLGRSTHASAALAIGRRGLNYIERIPLGYICLLQSEERGKSLLKQWATVNKRLKNVSPQEKSRCPFWYRDQAMFDLNTC